MQAPRLHARGLHQSGEPCPLIAFVAEFPIEKVKRHIDIKQIFCDPFNIAMVLVRGAQADN